MFLGMKLNTFPFDGGDNVSLSRPNFFHPSSRFAVVYQSLNCSRSTLLRLDVRKKSGREVLFLSVVIMKLTQFSLEGLLLYYKKDEN